LDYTFPDIILIDGEEEDGMDETLVPLDFKKNGQITDDDLNNMLVHTIPAGVTLTCVFDCCHSGMGKTYLSYP
jgi:metacaspase-1